MTYHASDCDGAPFCQGCGWIDADGHWRPGPCPDSERAAQLERSGAT